MSQNVDYLDDPTDPKYLTVCYVCKEIAKPGTQHLKNYGGVVCLSCRAFWRRIHQNTKSPNLICKKGDACKITVSTRRRCQKCRFVRCKATGMDPIAVLDRSQKTVRFRKVIEMQMMEETIGTDSLQATAELATDEFPRIRFKRKTKENEKTSKTKSNPKRQKKKKRSKTEDEDEDDEMEQADQNFHESDSEDFTLRLSSDSDDEIKFIHHSTTTNGLPCRNHLRSYMQTDAEPIATSNSTRSGRQLRRRRTTTETINLDDDDEDILLINYSKSAIAREANSHSSSSRSGVETDYKQTDSPNLTSKLRSLRKRKLVRQNTKTHSDYSLMSSSCQNDTISQNVQDGVTKNTSSVYSPIKSDLETITNAYSIAIGQGHSVGMEDLLSKLMLLNTDNSDAEISKEEILFAMQKLSQVFRHFALILREFVTLDKTLQRKLLCRNTPIFVQLYLGLFLLDRSSHTPGISMSRKRVWMSQFLQKNKLEKFNSTTNIFLPTANLDQYGGLICKLEGLPALFTLDQQSVLAYMILFDSNEKFYAGQQQDQLSKLKSHSESFYKSRIMFCPNCLDERGLAQILLSMANFCSQNIDWQDRRQLAARTCHNMFYSQTLPATPYCLEEDLLLSRQVQLVEASFSSVKSGDQLVRDFRKVSKCLHISDKHLVQVLRIFTERTLRASKIHPEFLGLTTEKQKMFFQRNIPLGVALLVARAENCSSATEQLRQGMGVMDCKTWTSEYMTKIKKLPEMKKMTIRYAGVFGPEELEKYFSHVADLKTLCSNPDLFKLAFLIVLTSPDKSSGEMSRVYNKYLTLLARKLFYNLNDSTRPGNFVRQCLNQMFSSFESAKQIAKLLTKVTTNGGQQQYSKAKRLDR